VFSTGEELRSKRMNRCDPCFVFVINALVSAGKAYGPNEVPLYWTGWVCLLVHPGVILKP